jgi:hypothetical protein
LIIAAPRNTVVSVRRGRRIAIPTVLVAALAGAPAAFGWSQIYEQNVVWGRGSSKISATNSITYNYVSFASSNGGLPQMGTTLCNASATSCYAWHWSNTGLITDRRTISYGFAACKANSGNNYLVYVRYCETGN